MDQLSLYHEDAHEAARTVVNALGGPTKVGQAMRPELAGKPAAARTWVNNCLDPDRAEKFDIDQWLWLMREGRDVGCHALATQICRDAGYRDPIPVTPEEEQDQLMRDFIEAQRSLGRISQRMSDLQERSAVRRTDGIR